MNNNEVFFLKFSAWKSENKKDHFCYKFFNEQQFLWWPVWSWYWTAIFQWRWGGKCYKPNPGKIQLRNWNRYICYIESCLQTQTRYIKDSFWTKRLMVMQGLLLSFIFFNPTPPSPVMKVNGLLDIFKKRNTRHEESHSNFLELCLKLFFFFVRSHRICCKIGHLCCI